MFKQIKPFLLSFAFAFFCFSLMVMSCVLWVKPYTQPHELPGVNHLSLPKEEDTLGIFLVYAGEEPLYFSTISLQPYQGKILISGYPPSAVLNGKQLSALWKNSGATAVQTHLAQCSGNKLERYIYLQERDIAALVASLGDVSLELLQPLTYKENGISITLEAGTHQLNSQQILHYLAQASAQAQYDALIYSLAGEIFNKLASDDGQSFFLSMLDHMESDLSLADHDHYGAALSFLVKLQPELLMQK